MCLWGQSRLYSPVFALFNWGTDLSRRHGANLEILGGLSKRYRQILDIHLCRPDLNRDTRQSAPCCNYNSRRKCFWDIQHHCTTAQRPKLVFPCANQGQILFKVGNHSWWSLCWLTLRDNLSVCWLHYPALRQFYWCELVPHHLHKFYSAREHLDHWSEWQLG